MKCALKNCAEHLKASQSGRKSLLEAKYELTALSVVTVVL
jgi:hypothetical protein